MAFRHFVQMVTACASVYADLVFTRVQATGLFSEESKLTPQLLSHVCASLNDLEHVKCALAAVPQSLQVATISAAVDSAQTAPDARRYGYTHFIRLPLLLKVVL